MTRAVIVTLLAFAVCPTKVAAQAAGDSSLESPLAKVRQAIESSRSAAMQGQVEASLRGLCQTLKNGPPVQLDIGEIVSLFTGRSSPNAGARREVEREVARGLFELDKLWRDKPFPPERVYRALRDIVLPPDHAGVYRYHATDAPSIESANAGSLLIEWATRQAGARLAQDPGAAFRGSRQPGRRGDVDGTGVGRRRLGPGSR